MKQITLNLIDNKRIYHLKNDSTNKAHIVQLRNNRYAALKPPKNKFMRLDKMLKSFWYKELKEYILSHINSNDSNDSNYSCILFFSSIEVIFSFNEQMIQINKYLFGWCYFLMNK